MSDLSIILRRFKRTNDPKLEIPNKGISFIPTEIYGFSHLEVLDLSNNAITSIDPKLSQLSNLKILDLSNNNLIMLPQALLNLSSLQVLKIEGNPLAKQFELLKKQENQVQPRLSEALKVAFGLQDSMEETKQSNDFGSSSSNNNNFSQNSSSMGNQGNLMKDIVNKDQEIIQLKKQNLELQKQMSRLSLTSGSNSFGGLNSNSGGLRISSQTETVLQVDISDLDIGQQISQGGFSTVHKGFFRGCPVAIKKIFNPNITEDLLDELNNEINMLASLRHPQIVQLMAIVSKAPNLCIVTDFLPNGDLYSLLHKQKFRNPDMSREKKVDIALQIAEIFQFMHANKIVHRDLKSLNILLDQSNRVKLCDFGLARRFEDLNQGNSKFSGTPSYMAYELYQKKAYDHKVDVFAFGTLLWEIFAREEPFGGLEPNEIMEKVQKEAPFPSSNGVDKQVGELVRKCRALRADKRPEFSQICEELRTWF